MLAGDRSTVRMGTWRLCGGTLPLRRVKPVGGLVGPRMGGIRDQLYEPKAPAPGGNEPHPLPVHDEATVSCGPPSGCYY